MNISVNKWLRILPGMLCVLVLVESSSKKSPNSRVSRWNTTVMASDSSRCRNWARSRCTASVESAYPHKIVAWRCTDGEEGKLTGTTRLAYWGTSREGDEKLLKEIGLAPLRVGVE